MPVADTESRLAQLLAQDAVGDLEGQALVDIVHAEKIDLAHVPSLQRVDDGLDLGEAGLHPGDGLFWFLDAPLDVVAVRRVRLRRQPQHFGWARNLANEIELQARYSSAGGWSEPIQVP
jgi:hypothetical protein